MHYLSERCILLFLTGTASICRGRDCSDGGGAEEDRRDWGQEGGGGELEPAGVHP